MRRLLLVMLLFAATPALAEEPTTFVISDSVADNYLVRQGAVRAHVLRLKTNPARLLVAFPAGNSGILLEFGSNAGPAGVKVTGAFAEADQGHGVEMNVHFSGQGATVANVVMGSLREIRNHLATPGLAHERKVVARFEEALARLPEADRQMLSANNITAKGAQAAFKQAWRAAADAEKRVLTMTRKEYLGDKEYRLTLTVPADCRALGGRKLTFSCNAALTVKLEAYTPYQPLTPIEEGKLFNKKAQAYFDGLRTRSTDLKPEVYALLDRARASLEFLASKEKLLAGSFRYLTYFGRDTLLTARMLMPVAGPAVLDAAYASVLARMSADGQVAHEEDIGNQAALRHMAKFAELVDRGQHQEATQEVLNYSVPVLDYKMIDDNFLLAPLVRDIIALDDEMLSKEQKKTLLAGPEGKRLERLAANLNYVLKLASEKGRKDSGIALAEGEAVGNWRDSPTGLGGGRYPADVNAFLLQSALVAIGEMLADPLFAEFGMEELVASGRFPFLGSARARADWVDGLLRDWEEAGKKYRVAMPLPHVRSAVTKYLNYLGPAARTYFDALEVSENCRLADFVAGRCYPHDYAQGLRFIALALDGKGKPIPVMHTDMIFALFDLPLPPNELEDHLRALTLPFPLGLMTSVGPVVANGAYTANEEGWKLFGPDAYHGAVVWGWVLGMLELGVMKQRTHLDPKTGSCAEACDELERISAQLEEARKRIPAVATSELWSWKIEGGKLEPVDFGAGLAHATVGNAVQLWSTVWLSVYHELNEAGE